MGLVALPAAAIAAPSARRHERSVAARCLEPVAWVQLRYWAAARPQVQRLVREQRVVLVQAVAALVVPPARQARVPGQPEAPVVRQGAAQDCLEAPPAVHLLALVVPARPVAQASVARREVRPAAASGAI